MFKNKWIWFFLIILNFIVACSVGNSYKTKNFFFDGVPPLKTIEVTNAFGEKVDSVVVVKSFAEKTIFHEPMCRASPTEARQKVCP